MGLSELKEEILQEAKDKGKAIEAEGRAQADLISKEANVEAADFERREREGHAKEQGEILRKYVAAAKFSAKRKLQEAKKQLIDECFDSAKKDLQRLSDAKRGELIRSLIERAKQELSVTKIFCNQKDKKFVTDVPVEVREMEGGIIAENRDGSIRIDLCFETLLGIVREESVEEIGGVLF